MEFNQYQNTAEMLKAIGHPVRLCIVIGLLKKESCHVSYLENCLKLPQSSVSTHLQKLRAAGIIVGKKKGLKVSYQLKDETIKNLVQNISLFIEPNATEDIFKRG
ncbi:ArsR/SmtB family transcription factor [Chengkuizengella marina]|uniref:ArsR family transcriptional regulator n=1 Tax=Chengkuizengella marina TaxID=2507566 RepID=A0A6N9Q2P7_9BACL|nr:metalloregulator ArsR/SmtB family transcription factor [Chengkuizengella marina]NBI28848.1 ArsR family transcriptional regulator [Chengkuizengella marina]